MYPNSKSYYKHDDALEKRGLILLKNKGWKTWTPSDFKDPNYPLCFPEDMLPDYYGIKVSLHGKHQYLVGDAKAWKILSKSVVNKVALYRDILRREAYSQGKSGLDIECVLITMRSTKVSESLYDYAQRRNIQILDAAAGGPSEDVTFLNRVREGFTL